MKSSSVSRFILFSIVLASLILTACGGDEEPAPVAEAAPAATATPAATAVPTSTATPTAAKSAVAAGGEPADETRTTTFVIVPEETTAGYAIKEVFISDNNALVTAVGKTTQVEGQFTLNYDDPGASSFGEFVVDVSTLRSDRSQRDRAIRSRWLESAKFPLARFTVTAVENFPADPQEGVPIQFQIVGDMTVKENTHPETWDVIATLEGERLTGQATLNTTLESFNIPIPNIINILRVQDGITLTLDFTFEAAE